MLDKADMLSCKSLSKAHRKRLMARACGVAIALVGAMSFGASPAENGSLDAIQPKDYIRSIMTKKQALCLIKLYGKESAFNRYAIGNPHGEVQAYGIPQLKNPAVAHMNAVEQIDAGIEYIRYRYGTPCAAYTHYLHKGWH